MIFVTTYQTTLEARGRVRWKHVISEVTVSNWVEQIKHDLEVYWSVILIPAQEENNV